MLTVHQTNSFDAVAKDGRRFRIKVYSTQFACTLQTADGRDVSHRNVPGEFTIPSLGNLTVLSGHRECFCQRCQSVHAPGYHTR